MTLDDIYEASKTAKLTQFNKEEIKWFESKITQKTDAKGKVNFYCDCLIRKKEIKLTPEEIVRQLYINKLNKEYGYSLDRMEVEVPVKMGRDDSKRADIVIYADQAKTKAYIIVELKAPDITITKEEISQLASYCHSSLGASIGILCNGRDTQNFYYKREDTKNKNLFLEKITYLPKANQTLQDVLNIRYTIKNLIQKDELKSKTLKNIILDFEDVVLANSGVDSFEEIFKFIFTKLYDEILSSGDSEEVTNQVKYGNKTIEQVDDTKFRLLEFRQSGTDEQIKARLDNLFLKAQDRWQGIFNAGTTFLLRPSEMKICVSRLQDVKLLNSNLEVVDDAFEYLVNKEQKGNKGQYFTPRYVIDMCVRMLNPKEDEAMIDTAAGSCGFPMHTIFHVWHKINPDAPNLFTIKKRSDRELDYVKNKVFAIDFDKRSVRVGRTLNLIAGDGNTNVLLLNSLEYNQWKVDINETEWRKVYNDGFFRLDAHKTADDYSQFDFDILMANPPFAGDIKNDEVVGLYRNLGFDNKDKVIKNTSRDILFIERNLNFLKPGGRMAIVLPQGRFNNSTDKRIRDFIAKKCRILAVVGLHGNTFKPHTGTKTSVLFVQKWTGESGVCPYKEDYNIFFATQQRPGKDNSGEKIYVKDENGTPKRDSHGHIFVDHDLYNHEGLTQDGIAEAFAEFAKVEGLSFF